LTVYKSILVPIDGSDTAQRGLNEAIALAKSLGSRIRLLHVINEAPLLSPLAMGTSFERLFEQVRNYGTSMLHVAETAVQEGGIEVDTQLIEANGNLAGEQILREAASWPADLIVCGTHGRRGIRRIVMGSDAEYVVRQSPVPVLLIRARENSR
jgi:nucleotide-binding universal stress UspA family protein